MGHEPESFAAGEADKQIIAYRGWNIRLLICYDLRFPVWSRNTANEYDLLIYVANWPERPAFGVGHSSSRPRTREYVLRLWSKPDRNRCQPINI